MSTPRDVLEIYNEDGPGLVKDLRRTHAMLRNITHLIRPPLPCRRHKGQWWLWEETNSVHIYLSHFVDIFEKRNFTFGDISEVCFEEAHKRSKKVAHQFHGSSGSTIQNLAILSAMAIDERGEKDTFFEKVRPSARNLLPMIAPCTSTPPPASPFLSLPVSVEYRAGEAQLFFTAPQKNCARAPGGDEECTHVPRYPRGLWRCGPSQFPPLQR